MSQQPISDHRHQQAALNLLQNESPGDRRFKLRVIGPSMAPLLRPGDRVIAEHVRPAELNRGDLVVVRRSEDLVTHRLIFIDGCGWHTKGDNSLMLDPPVTSDAIMGRVIAIERGNQSIDLGTGHWSTVNRWLALSGWCEIKIIQAGRSLRKYGRKNKSGRSRSLVVRMITLPFRLLTRLLLRF